MSLLPETRSELFRFLAIPCSVISTLASAALLTTIILSLKNGISARVLAFGMTSIGVVVFSQRIIGEITLQYTDLMTRDDMSWLIIRPSENKGKLIPWEEIRTELIVFVLVAFAGVWVFQWYVSTMLSTNVVSIGEIYLYSIPPAIFISVFSAFPSLLIWMEEVGVEQDTY